MWQIGAAMCKDQHMLTAAAFGVVQWGGRGRLHVKLILRGNNTHALVLQVRQCLAVWAMVSTSADQPAQQDVSCVD